MSNQGVIDFHDQLKGISKAGSYTLHVLCGEKSEQIKIHPVQGGGYKIADTKYFPGLPALVEYHRNHSLAMYFTSINTSDIERLKSIEFSASFARCRSSVRSCGAGAESRP